MGKRGWGGRQRGVGKRDWKETGEGKLRSDLKKINEE